MHRDHRVEIYLTASEYLSLMARAEHEARTMSGHVRYLLRLDLESSVDEIVAYQKWRDGGSKAEAGGKGRG